MVWMVWLFIIWISMVNWLLNRILVLWEKFLLWMVNGVLLVVGLLLGLMVCMVSLFWNRNACFICNSELLVKCNWRSIIFGLCMGVWTWVINLEWTMIFCVRAELKNIFMLVLKRVFWRIINSLLVVRFIVGVIFVMLVVGTIVVFGVGGVVFGGGCCVFGISGGGVVGVGVWWVDPYVIVIYRFNFIYKQW